jgi:hypothetical protein
MCVNGAWKLIFDFSDAEEIVVPSDVEVLGSYFAAGTSPLSLSFEPDSKLQRIGAFALSDSKLQDIEIPEGANLVDGYSFGNLFQIIAFYHVPGYCLHFLR